MYHPHEADDFDFWSEDDEKDSPPDCPVFMTCIIIIAFLWACWAAFVRLL